MSGTPKWKVYLDGEYVAACKHAEDAAAIVAMSNSGVVKYDHKTVVWNEGSEEFSACDSYDRAAQVMHERIDEIKFRASDARLQARIGSES